MEKIKAFKDAEDFQRLFGLDERGNRRNKILLATLKHRPLWDWCKRHDDWSILATSSMPMLKTTIMFFLHKEHNEKRGNHPDFNWSLRLNGETWYSGKYATDDRKGICLDTENGEDDASFIRYYNMATNKPYKMKAGKLYKSLFETCEFWQSLPQQAQTWLLEELVQSWKSYVTDQLNKYHLVINTDFERIYDGYYCVGDFGSCMTDEGQQDFYRYAVKNVNAAYLEDDNSTIVARCIIFNQVFDEDGKIWRLAERQYATGLNELYKQMLVNALIKAKAIDGYKRIGAGCGDSTSFVDVEGNSLADKDFSIECRISHGDTLSYQDSFKYYIPEDGRAYNRRDLHDCEDDDRLDVTDREFYGYLSEWDDYHDRWCHNTVEVHYQGSYYQCDEDDLNDFEYFDGSYYHEDDILTCDRCGDRFLNPESYYNSYGVHSDLLDEDFCSSDCLDEAENEYKEENWFHADLEEDYVEDKSLLATYLALVGNKYIVQTFLKDRLNRYLSQKVLFSHNGVLVDDPSKIEYEEMITEEYLNNI